MPHELPSNIDDSLTREQLGYPATSVSPGSSRKVVYRCATCETPRATNRNRIYVGLRCKPCAQTDPVVVAKRITTIRERHGTDSEVQKKAQRTFRAKNVDYTHVVAKRRATIAARFGELGLATPALTQRRKDTILQTFGAEGTKHIPRHFGGVTKEIGALLEAWGVTPVVYEQPLPSGKRLDITVPGLMVAIEYCGLYWHNESSPTPRMRSYHLDKLREANGRGWRLFTIFEDEWLNRRSMVENVLQAALAIHSVKIGARKCKLREVSYQEGAAFLNAHHLQGASTRTSRSFGLFHGDTLVGVATLAKHHRNLNMWVLNRLCFASGVSVVGGARRLINQVALAAKAAGASQLITWSDRRWSDGAVYHRAGFKQEAVLGPDYSYTSINKPGERRAKQLERKTATSCPIGLTEHAWAKQRGLSKIWDCGRIRWSLPIA